MTAPDPMQTLVTVAQLRNMQSQEQLRQLQMADISSKLQTYQAMQDPNSPLAQLAGLRAGGGGGGYGAGPGQGMVQGTQLGAQALPSPMQAPPGGVPPAPPGESYTRPAPPTWRPGAQDAATMSYQPAGAPDAAIMANVPPGGISQQMPQIPPPAGRESAPAAPAQLPTTPGGDDSARIANLYRQMYAKYRPDIVEPLVNSYMNIDKNLLEQQKGKLEFQKAGLNVIEQGMATVMDQDNPAEAYAQVRQMWVERGIPGAQQMPPQFNPQWVQTMATNARTAKERIDQQLTAWERQNTAYDNQTKRLKVTVVPTAAGNLLQRESPEPGTTGTTVQPGIGGGVAVSPEVYGTQVRQAELGKVTTALDAQGNIIPVPTVPGAQTGPLGGPNPAGGGGPLIEPGTGKPYVSMEAVKNQAEIEQAGRARWEEIQKPFQSISRAYSQVLASSTPEAATHQNTADLSLLKAFAHLNNPESVRLNSEMTPEQLGGLGERAKEIWQKVVVGGGVLTDPQRREVIAQSAILYKTAEGHMHQQLAAMREQYAGYGPRVRPGMVAPDITANQPGQQTAVPSAPRVVTAPMLDAMATRLAPQGATPAQIQQLREQLRQRLRLAGKQVP
jgi:hypothetical protein